MEKQSLPELIVSFLTYLEVEKKASQLTIRNYRHYLNRFLEFLKKQSSSLSAIEDIDKETIRKYRLFLLRYKNNRGKQLGRKTRGFHVIALRSFLRYLIKHNVDVVVPDKVGVPKSEMRKIEALSTKQLEWLFAQPNPRKINELRDKAILEVLFCTGLRVAEFVRLNRDQMNLERMEFGILGKGNRRRVVFLSNNAVHWIERYLGARKDNYKPLFIRHSGAQEDQGDEQMRLTPRSVQRVVQKYTKRAKLPVKVTPHVLRHSYATDLLSSGADIRSVQEMLGHKNISTTQIYTHVTNPQLRKVHEKFHSGNK